MTTIIIFALALFFAISIIFFKALDLKKGKSNFVYTIIGKFDRSSAVFVEKIKFSILQFIQSIRYIILVKIRNKITDFVSQEIRRILNEYENKQKIFMGRKNIANNGSVSFYLKKIKDQKAYDGKGKID